MWMFPVVFSFHSTLIYGVYQPWWKASMILVLAAFALGIATRLIRSATRLLALLSFLLGFLFLYLIGVLSPAAFCAVVERRDWIGWTLFGSSLLIASMLWWRVRESLRIEWSAPLEESPGVVLNRDDNTLVRYPVPTATNGFSKVFVGCGAVLILLFVFFRLIDHRAGTLVVALFVLPIMTAVLCTDTVGRVIAYFWVARRWERDNGIELKVPPLG